MSYANARREGCLSEIVLEIDERRIENLMMGAHVFIEASSSPHAKKIAYFNKSAFQAHSRLVDEYACDGFSIEIQDVVEGRLQESFSPDFINIQSKDVIREIGIVGSGAFAKDFDSGAFKAFRNTERLTTHDVSFGPELPELFPKLKAWRNLDWKANRIEVLDGRWSTLENISLQNFNGSLSIFGGASIKKLFLIGSAIKDIEDVLFLENLEVLQFVSCRISGDVSVLSRLKKLRSLRFEGKSKLEGWGRLESETMENFAVSHYPCKFPREGFPRIKNFAINAYRNRDPFYEAGGDVEKIDDEFGSIFDRA